MYNLPIICTIRRQIYNTSSFLANFFGKIHYQTDDRANSLLSNMKKDGPKVVLFM